MPPGSPLAILLATVLSFVVADHRTVVALLGWSPKVKGQRANVKGQVTRC
jgi:hypothetical protein